MEILYLFSALVYHFFTKREQTLISRFLSMLHVARCISQSIVGVRVQISFTLMLCKQCCNNRDGQRPLTTGHLEIT